MLAPDDVGKPTATHRDLPVLGPLTLTRHHPAGTHWEVKSGIVSLGPVGSSRAERVSLNDVVEQRRVGRR